MHWASMPLCLELSSRMFSRSDFSPTFRTPEAAARRGGVGSVSHSLPYKVLPTEAASACEIVRRLRRTTMAMTTATELGRTWAFLHRLSA